jgi:hypothetical protein
MSVGFTALEVGDHSVANSSSTDSQAANEGAFAQAMAPRPVAMTKVAESKVPAECSSARLIGAIFFCIADVMEREGVDPSEAATWRSPIKFPSVCDPNEREVAQLWGHNAASGLVLIGKSGGPMPGNDLKESCEMAVKGKL